MSTRAVREKTPNFVDRAMGELCGIYASVVTLPPAAADPATVFHACLLYTSDAADE